jgi:hypothetical protein
MDKEHPSMTIAKREFMAWYETKNTDAIDSDNGR